MTSFEEKFKGVLLLWLQKKAGIRDAEEIFAWEDYTSTWGGCATCSYSEYEVEIIYLNTAGGQRTYTYNGHFSDLLEELIDVDE